MSEQKRPTSVLPPLVRVTPESMTSYFSSISDPRVEGRCDHDLLDILVIATCAVICGADSFVEMALFAQMRGDWLKQYLPLRNGIPSHDTFARVFSLIPPEQFERAFLEWVSTVSKSTRRICIDGKTVRGTDKSTLNRSRHALHLVSIYASDLGLGLFQTQAHGSAGGEPRATLECIAILGREHLKDTLVSVDAGISNRRVTRALRRESADYLVTIKRNQRFTLKEMEQIFRKPHSPDSYREKVKARGRVEVRSCRVLAAQPLASLMLKTQWQDIQTLIEMKRERTAPDKRYLIQETGNDGKQKYRKNEKTRRTETEVVYYLSSRKLDAESAAQAIREHWLVENRYHWSLDVIFNEDDWRVRDHRAARNLSLVRRMALNYLKNLPGKEPTKHKRLRAKWTPHYLADMIFSTS